MKKSIRFDRLRDEQGASLIELALLLPLFMLLILGAVDMGRAFYLSMEVAGAAHAAAIWAEQNPTDTTGIENAAQDDAPNVTLSFPTLTYGCECATDTAGTTYNANCTVPPTCSGQNNVVHRVKITVTGSYTPLLPWNWKGIGAGKIPSISFSSSASVRSAGS